MGVLRLVKAAVRAHPALAGILLVALALMLLGISWGLPNSESWSNDSIAPWLPLRVPRTYFFGSHKYPYLHSWLSLALYSPYLLFLLATGGLDLGCFPRIHEGCFSAPHTQLAVLIAISRLLSVAMGVGTVYAVYRLALRLHGDAAAARLAAAVAACSFVLVYYAHVGNLDVPQCLWFVASLWAFAGVLQHGARRDYLAFGLLAGLAIGTKEGILGAYVGAGLAILVVHVGRGVRDAGGRGPRVWLGACLDRRLLGLVGAALAVYVVATNPILNWSGFVEHWKEWLPSGERMTGYRDRFVGYPELLLRFLGLLDDAMGLPLLALCAAGLLHAAWRRPRTLVLLVPAATYFAFSVAPAGFAPLRFSLPVVVILAVYGGMLAARLLALPGAARAAGVALVALALGHGFLIALAGDLTMLGDTRYRAEAWLRENVPAGARVATFAQPRYLPRLAYLGYEVERLPAEELGAEVLARARPPYLVLSSFYYPRLRDRHGGFVDELLGGELGYRVVWDEQAHPRLSRWLGRPPEAIKANPRIVVLRREEAAGG